MSRIAFILALLISVALASVTLGQSTSVYRITHTFALGGDGRWDYVIPDPPRHRLFIGRQNRVMVVDVNDGKLLGEVTGINGAHGVALAEHFSLQHLIHKVLRLYSKVGPLLNS